jgi:hypothetical protein
MKTNIHYWSYLVQFFLEREKFQTKVVDRIKAHVLKSTFFFSKIVTFMRCPKKKNIGGQAIVGSMAHVHCTPDTKGYKYILRKRDTYCFSTAKMVTRTRLNVMLQHITWLTLCYSTLPDVQYNISLYAWSPTSSISFTFSKLSAVSAAHLGHACYIPAHFILLLFNYPNRRSDKTAQIPSLYKCLQPSYHYRLLSAGTPSSLSTPAPSFCALFPVPKVRWHFNFSIWGRERGEGGGEVNYIIKNGNERQWAFHHKHILSLFLDITLIVAATSKYTKFSTLFK